MTKTRRGGFSKRRRRGGRKTKRRRGGRKRSRVTKRGGKRRSRVTKRGGVWLTTTTTKKPASFWTGVKNLADPLVTAGNKWIGYNLPLG